jgi:uncharacterized protein involved in cysteine biosynthesis
MDRVFRAFFRSLASQLHPAMLALLLVPFGVAIVLWGLVAWLAWDPLLDWLRRSVFDGIGILRWFFDVSSRFGLDGLRSFLSVLVALMLLIPLMFATAVGLIAVLAMPLVNRHLGNGPYQSVERRGSWSVGASVWNACSTIVIFLVGYIVTLPLWLIPPLALLVPWLWWSWMTARMMRFDSLVEHADPYERTALIRGNRREYFMLGLLVTALNYIPPLFLITPVLSALAFGHYSLARLREQREAIVQAGAAASGARR